MRSSRAYARAPVQSGLLAACLVIALQIEADNGMNDRHVLITSADISREKPADLVELLRSRVGVDEHNGVISMRGVSGIAIYVDGFASSGTELRAIRPEQVESIEIFRGASSARFGAEAMEGAIAVTTLDHGAGSSAHMALTQGLDCGLGHVTRFRTGKDEREGLSWSLLAERKWVHGYRWKKAGYAVLDLSATWNRPLWSLTLALDNALSRDYVTGFFWHGEPRTLHGVAS